MAWQRVTPGSHAGLRAAATVKIGLRKPGGREKGMRLAVRVAGPLRHKLGWEPRMRVSVDIDTTAGAMRIQPDDQGAMAFHHDGGGSTGLEISWNVRDTLGMEPKASELAPHRIEGGAIVMTLPVWAAPECKGFRAAAQAAAAAKERAGYRSVSDRTPDPASAWRGPSRQGRAA